MKRIPRPGTRVVFDLNPASYVLYSHPPHQGEKGVVVKVSLGGHSSHYMPGPGGGLVYVKWNESQTQGVAPQDLRRQR